MHRDKVDENFLDFIDIGLLNEKCIELKVEYSWRPLIHSFCNKFGRINEECKANYEKKPDQRGRNAY